MRILDEGRAMATFERMGLHGSNLSLTRYWLSLCKDGELPRKEDFEPRRIKSNLPGIALFEVAHSGAVVCRLAGTAIDRGLGWSMVGKDFISLLPEEERPIRVSRLHKVVTDSAGLARTRFQIHGREFVQENLLLPFDGISETGSQHFLLHTNVRPNDFDLLVRPEAWNTSLPEDYQEIALFH
ncbi:MAG TPA: PAS domain-containing protein [Rhizomicrobium sp.]|nr:PAS domain-containing protein [Rhizomicrobium sp.]